MTDINFNSKLAVISALLMAYCFSAILYEIIIIAITRRNHDLANTYEASKNNIFKYILLIILISLVGGVSERADINEIVKIVVYLVIYLFGLYYFLFILKIESVTVATYNFFWIAMLHSYYTEEEKELFGQELISELAAYFIVIFALAALAKVVMIKISSRGK